MLEFMIMPKHFGVLDIVDEEVNERFDRGQFIISDSERVRIVKKAIHDYFSTDRIVEELNNYFAKMPTYKRYKWLDCGGYNERIVVCKYNEDRTSYRFKVSGNLIAPLEREEIVEMTEIGYDKLYRTFYQLAFTWIFVRVNSHMKDIMFKKCLALDSEKQTDIMKDQWIILGTYEDLLQTYYYLLKC